MKRFIFLSILLGLGVIACQPAPEASQDRVLAKVYNKTLYLSELEGMFPENTSAQDSTLIVQAYTQRWVREALILHEAERNIPSDLNIDKLVRDYRASLLRHNYEEVLVREKLDSTISKEQLEAFYEANKNQYQLETPIMRCHFIKFPLPVDNESEIRNWWQNTDEEEDFQKLVDLCNISAQAHHLVDSTWQRLEDVAIELPKNSLTPENISPKKEFIIKDDNFMYFFRAFEVKNQKEIAPLAFIQGQARKFILHKRKKEVLDKTLDDMLELSIGKKGVEIYY